MEMTASRHSVSKSARFRLGFRRPALAAILSPLRLRSQKRSVELWTSPSDRREPYGPCGRPVDHADALPTGLPTLSRLSPTIPQDLQQVFGRTAASPFSFDNLLSVPLAPLRP